MAIASATWRDGVHLTGTSIWCDARRGKGVWFVSSLERVDRAQRQALGKGVGQLVATEATLAMVDRAGRGDLSAPYRQRFTLGTLRLELVPSGRGLGAAALLADDAGRRILYAGSVRTRSGGLGELGEVRACDAVVVGAPYGEVRDAFPSIDDAAAQTLAWVRAQVAATRAPVLFVDTMLDAFEVGARLAAAGFAVAGPRPLRDCAAIAKRFEAVVPSMIAPPRSPAGARRTGANKPASNQPGGDAEGKPVVAIWLDGDRAAAIAQLGARVATALVSGRAVEGLDGCDAAFAWAGAAGRTDLLGWIESTGARDIFVTGPRARAIVATLGPRARVLGPPEQMPLFGGLA